MSEIRLDDETGGWRLLVPERAGRPEDRWGTHHPCPFCPGNEAMTPLQVLRVPAGEGDWRVRVVPNMYPLAGPALHPHVPTARHPGWVDRHSFPYTGSHEVLVESPQHTWRLEQASAAETTEIFFTLRERCRALARHDPAAVVVFRNHREAAGTSQRHPHSQIVALDHAPPGVTQRWDRARLHYGQTGRCLHEHIAERERAVGSRVIHDADAALVFQPHAATTSYEMCILPDEPAADLAGASDNALAAVAELVPRAVGALGRMIADAAYNLVVHSGPVGVTDASVWFRWHVSVQPRLTVPGGFELATGLTVAPSLPEHTAPLLRQAFAATAQRGEVTEDHLTLTNSTS
jgi:UDPglucose--hexose-1-phosphate uridylyltransferase